MKSIDRLREYGARFNNSRDAWSGIGTEILEFADEIEHDVDDMWHALTIDAKPMTDENMAENGWIRLPLDADGVPIHIGDVMEWSDGETFEVVGIGDTGTLYYLETRDDGTVGIEWTSTECKRHHAPTVEDVLQEFTDEVWNRCCEGATASDSGIDELVAEYAAKFRLASNEE